MSDGLTQERRGPRPGRVDIATAERLSSLDRVFHCHRFDRVAPGAARSADLAKHTAGLRYLFGTLTADGYDDTDRQVSSWMQARWVAFARDGAPADRSDWPAYGDGGGITIIDGVPAHGRIDDEPVVPLLHATRIRRRDSTPSSAPR